MNIFNLFSFSKIGEKAKLEAAVKERKLSEEALRQSEERYRTILASMEDGYFEVDLAGNLLFSNEANDRIFGLTRGEQIGMNYREYTDPENAKKVFEVFNKVYRTGVPHKGFEWELVRKDGSKFYVETSVSLILDADHQKMGFRGIIRDDTRQKQTEASLRQSEERYRSILDSIEDGYFEVDLAGNMMFCNYANCRILGYPMNELIGMNNRQYMDEENSKKVYETFSRVYRYGLPDTGFDWELIRKDGSKIYVETSVSLILDSNQQKMGFRGVIRDITRQKQTQASLRQSEERYRTILASIEDGYFEMDLAGNMMFCNNAHCHIMGYPMNELIGMNNRQYMEEEGAQRVYKTFNKVYRSGLSEKDFEYELIRKDGSKIYVEASVSLILDSKQQKVGFRGIVRDVTGQKQAEEVLKAMSLVDDLTGVNNRRGFLTLAEQELKIANRMERATFLIFADLDDLKGINDTYGHLEGDQALKDIAHILKETFRDPDILARIGGDEFVILAIEGASEAGPDLLVERLRKNLELSNKESSRPYNLSLSLGVAGYDPEHPVSIETLLLEADRNMYEEKQGKRKSTQLRIEF